MIAVLPLALALWHAFELQGREQQATRVRLLRDRAESAADAVDSRFELGAKLVRALARVEADGPGWQPLRKHLNVWLNIQTAVSSVEVVDDAGKEVFNSRRTESTIEPTRHCKSGRQPLSATARGEPRWAGLSGAAVRIAVPLRGAFDGCIAMVSMSQEPINRVLDRKQWPRDWIVSLIDPTGRIAARSIDAKPFVGSKATQPLLDAIAGGSNRAFLGRSIDGVNVYAYVAAVPGHPDWHVAVGAPVSAIDRATRNFQENVLACIVAALGLACGLAVWMAARLSREVRALLLPSEASTPLVISEVREVAVALRDAAIDMDAISKEQVRTIGALRDEIARRRALESQLKTVQRRLLVSQELERKHLSRELHDELGQDLALLRLTLRSLAEGSVPGARRLALLDDCIATSERLAEHLRQMSVDLRPPQLDDIGLVAALRSLVRRLAGQGTAEVRLQASEEDDLTALNDDVATALYRIAQSGLTNALRHAQSEKVVIRLEAATDSVSLSIEDDGKGFDVAEVAASETSHLGLIIMQERVTALGGALHIDSSPGQGTRVLAVVPLTAESP
ncbi:MAG: ATP-binding protein [Rhizobacter sp.]